MADIVIPNEGKILALDRWLAPDDNPGETWHVRLFKNDYTPVVGSTLASFTQADFTGYSEFDIDQSDWGGATIVSDVAVNTAAVAPSFTCTSGTAQLVYGWYAVGATSGKVLAAERFASSRNMVPGAVEKLDPFSIKFQTFH